VSASGWEPVLYDGRPLLVAKQDHRQDEDADELEHVQNDGHIPLPRTAHTQVASLLDCETILGAERTLDAIHVVVTDDVSRKETLCDHAVAGSKMYGLAIIHNTGFAADVAGL